MKRRESKKFLVGALSFSLLIHAVALVLLHFHCLNFKREGRMVSSSFGIPFLEKKVSEVMKSFVFLDPSSLQSQKPLTLYPSKEDKKSQAPSSYISTPKTVEIATSPLVQLPIPSPISPTLKKEQFNESKKSFSISSDWRKNISPLSLSQVDKVLQFSFTENGSMDQRSYFSIPSLKPSIEVVSTTYEDVDQEELYWKEMLEEKLIKLAPPAREDRASDLTFSLPTLEDLQVVSLDDYFQSEISWVPDAKEGNLFAVTLIPKEEKSFPRLKNSFFFLVDRGNSIQKSRLATTRHAIITALSTLEPEDSFTIFAFDSKFEELFEAPRRINDKNLHLAKKFLLDQNLGSIFFASNVNRPLDRVLEFPFSSDELRTIILLSDGDSFSKQKNVKFIEEWIAKNDNRVVVYAVGLQDDKYGPFLDFVGFLNGGKRMVSMTDRGIKRQVMKLMKNLHSPIASTVQISYLQKEKEDLVRLSTWHFPALYKDQPYVILGSTKSLHEGYVLLQGKMGEKWVHVKKKINFSEEKGKERFLSEEWVVHKAYKFYEQYLYTPNKELLKKAETLLQPFSIPPAIQ